MRWSACSWPKRPPTCASPSPARARTACSVSKSFEEALKKRFSHKVLDGMTVPADGLNSDLHGSAEYRAHLIAVLARRAVEAATAK